MKEKKAAERRQTEWVELMGSTEPTDLARPEEQTEPTEPTDLARPEEQTEQTEQTGHSALPDDVPKRERPTVKIPAREMSVADIPAADTSTKGAPAADAPAADAPAADTPAKDAPMTDTPAEDTPAASTPAEEMPARETLANGTPVYITKSHRFGQDALLLAHFCGVHRRESACDLGCDCGIIALRWHDRGHRGPCLAVELSSEAAALARRAAAEAGVEHITVQNCDLREASALRPYAQTCSLVACNPPYFTGGFLSPDPERAAARHALSCTTEDVCAAAFLLLRDGGRLCVCQRPERLADVFCAMRAAHIEPKRLQFVAARSQKAPWLVLVEGQKNRAPGLRVLPMLITARADGTPSRKMLEIYGQAPQAARQPEQE